ncbi:uncharacterized protein [Gossypium hirsutum]|uniref:Reverse transcriptase domain-containing protein n=1 Tax=Gossypium hirsutum TaxID=3635 RepID=A0ABM3A523_GOSHI|nr:uncharacterized protein LOC121217775 [Gossypium hirsutum]
MAVFDMGSTKAPGEDGFLGLFYQKCWHIIGDKVTDFCLHLLNGDMKTLANRFRRVIEKCIEVAQSAFVLERLISDNVLLAYEILNTLKGKRIGKKRWVKAIMQCITTVSYSVAMNRHREEKFQPTRGLRQCDPLSPFLFLLCGERLSKLLRLAEREGLLRGVKVSRNGPPISHILFADDYILFREATRSGVHLFKNILEEYRLCSGQCVNFDKSTVVFSKNTSEEEKQTVVNLLGVRSSNEPERYLGLPNMVGKRKKEAFQNLKDSLKKRIDNWSTKFITKR